MWYDLSVLSSKTTSMKKSKTKSTEKKGSKPNLPSEIDSWNIGNYGSRQNSEEQINKGSKPKK
jgi:hypothetical protein